MAQKKPKVVIGVGNYLLEDEGVGIHAINYLQQFSWPDDVELIDAGLPGLSLIYMLEERELAIIIDCADFRGKPGEVLVVEPEKLKKESEDILSLHGTSLLGTLALAEETDVELGKIFIVCVQPKGMAMRMDLTDAVAHSLPDIKKEIEKLLY